MVGLLLRVPGCRGHTAPLPPPLRERRQARGWQLAFQMRGSSPLTHPDAPPADRALPTLRMKPHTHPQPSAQSTSLRESHGPGLSGGGDIYAARGQGQAAEPCSGCHAVLMSGCGKLGFHPQRQIKQSYRSCCPDWAWFPCPWSSQALPAAATHRWWGRRGLPA